MSEASNGLLLKYLDYFLKLPLTSSSTKQHVTIINTIIVLLLSILFTMNNNKNTVQGLKVLMTYCNLRYGAVHYK